MIKRLGLQDEPCAVYHVSPTVNWKTWHLAPSECAEAVLRQLRTSLALFGVTLLAFVLMSNHLHLVLLMPPEERFRLLTGRRTRSRHLRPWPPGHQKAAVLSQFMKRFRFCCSREIQDLLGISGQFWHGKYHARRVREPLDLIYTIAYDHFNPVKQGMAERPEQYDRSSAAWWQGDGSSPVPLATAELPFDLDVADLRAALLEYQNSRQFPSVARHVAEENLRLDSEEGYRRLVAILEENGLPTGAYSSVRTSSP